MVSTPVKFKMESGIQLLSRLRKNKEIRNYYPTLFESGIKNEDLIEMSSDGKRASFLIIDIICEALVPSELDGPEIGVVLLATDGSISHEKILKVLTQKLLLKISQYNSNGNLDTTLLDTLLLKSLKNFHLLEVYDATQFYCTLYNFENVVSAYPNISLILIENLVAFYWSEQGFKIIKMDLYQKKILKIVQTIIKEYKIPVLYYKPQYFHSSKESEDTKIQTINYKIEVSSNLNDTDIFNVSIFTGSEQEIKYFKIINDQLTWLRGDS